VYTDAIVGMPTLDRWPFPQDPVPRSWVAASKMTVAAVGIFSKIWAGQWHHHMKQCYICTETNQVFR